MRKLHLLCYVMLVGLILPPFAFGALPLDVTPLGNKDIVLMVEHKVETELIIKAIKSSPCTFDTFPPVLKEMKRQGVPEEVLQAMLEAPYGPSSESKAKDDLGEQPIYHYAEQLKQMGLLMPVISGRGLPSRQTRARATRSRQRS